MLKTDMRLRVQGHGAGVLLGKVLANADTRQILACHCEEQSDVAIRIPAEEGKSKQNLRRNGKWYEFARSTALCFVLLRGERIATPRRPKVRHVVAPKSAMPSSGQRPEQGNAPLGLLSPQRVPLCGAPCTGSQ